MKHYTAEEWRVAFDLVELLIVHAANELGEDRPEPFDEAHATVEAMLAGAADMQVLRNDLDELEALTK